MPTLTPDSTRRLALLTPHTRGHALQLLSEFPLLQVSSGRRSARHNARVGGVPGSFHVSGRAVDLVGPTWDLIAASRRAWSLRLGKHCTGPEEVLLEYLGTPRAHLHVAW